jgi:hypothetical protein
MKFEKNFGTMTETGARKEAKKGTIEEALSFLFTNCRRLATKRHLGSGRLSQVSFFE